jgi:hypothetical protein
LWVEGGGVAICKLRLARRYVFSTNCMLHHTIGCRRFSPLSSPEFLTLCKHLGPRLSMRRLQGCNWRHWSGCYDKLAATCIATIGTSLVKWSCVERHETLKDGYRQSPRHAGGILRLDAPDHQRQYQGCPNYGPPYIFIGPTNVINTC